MTKLDELVSFILSDKLKEIRNFDCYDELVAEAQKLQREQVKNIAYEPVLAPSYDRADMQDAFNAGGVGESWDNWIKEYDSPI